MAPHPVTLLLVSIASLALATAAAAQAPDRGAAPGGPEGPITLSLQGSDVHRFMDNPHIRAFYALSVADLGQGVERIDVDAYEQRSFGIFRAWGEALGRGGAKMQDDLKLIPRQVVAIVAEDPAVLHDFESFLVALIGPR